MREKVLLEQLESLTNMVQLLGSFLDRQGYAVPTEFHDKIEEIQGVFYDELRSMGPRVVIAMGSFPKHHVISVETVEEGIELAKRYATSISGWQQVHSVSVWNPNGIEPVATFRGGWKNESLTSPEA